MKLACDIHVLCGTFASQPLVFAHLLDAADAQNLSLDFDYIEVVQSGATARLAGWFTQHVVDKILQSATGETLVLVFPGANGTLAPTALLDVVGSYPGTITRAMLDT